MKSSDGSNQSSSKSPSDQSLNSKESSSPVTWELESVGPKQKQPRTSLEIAFSISQKYWEVQELLAYIMHSNNNYSLERQ